MLLHPCCPQALGISGALRLRGWALGQLAGLPLLRSLELSHCRCALALGCLGVETMATGFPGAGAPWGMAMQSRVDAPLPPAACRPPAGPC